jgi:hypothetical protein
MNVKAGLVKTEPTLQVEVLRQPIFNNPLVTNMVGHPLGVNGFNEGRAITKASCTKIKDIWDREDREWKRHPTFRMNYHVINKTSRDTVISSIPSNPTTFPSHFQIGNWISNMVIGNRAPFTWIYRLTESSLTQSKPLNFAGSPPTTSLEP